MQQQQLPVSFETRFATDKNGRQCFVISFDSAQFERYVSELVSCFTQASYIPEVSIYSAENKAWHYNVINTIDPGSNRMDVHIDALQEALIEVIASVSLHKSKARTPTTRKPASKTRSARKLKAV